MRTRSGHSRTRTRLSRTSREPVVSGDRATVEWWAVTTSGGEDATLAGVSLLRFDDDGLVIDQRDYWHLEQGRREL